MQREEREFQIQELNVNNDSKFRQEELDLKKKMSAFSPAAAP